MTELLLQFFLILCDILNFYVKIRPLRVYYPSAKDRIQRKQIEFAQFAWLAINYQQCCDADRVMLIYDVIHVL